MRLGFGTRAVVMVPLRPQRSLSFEGLLCLLLFTTVACSMPARGPAVPAGLTTQAALPGLRSTRYYPGDDADTGRFVQDAIRSSERSRAYAGDARAPFSGAEYLALSGGGDNGAFGAGLLVGWSETGTRPEFEVVTGTSTGALIAPFAFLGPDYDDDLRGLYTTRDSSDIFEPRNLLNAALFDDAIGDTTPLKELIQERVDEEFLRAIAFEWTEKGRWLLVATTNLDAGRQVIWNMGAIAASENPAAPGLFRDVLLASAAVPGAFPPVMLDVVADGNSYQEMHIDGGAISQTFFVHSSFAGALRQEGLGMRSGGRLYVVRNAAIDPEWTTVDRQTLSITARAIGTLLRSQGVDDLFRIYLHAGVDGIEFRLAYIDEGFQVPREGVFDRAYMTALFEHGYEKARVGYPWAEVPPAFVE